MLRKLTTLATTFCFFLLFNTTNSFAQLTLSPGDTTLCHGESITLNGGGATVYHWFPPVSMLCVNDSQVIVNPSTPTKYYLEGIQPDGSRDTLCVTVVVKDLPTFDIFSLADIGCIIDSGQVGQHGGGNPDDPRKRNCITACDSSVMTYYSQFHAGSNYQWTVTGGTLINGQGSDSIQVHWGSIGSGSINLTVTDSCGCVDSADLCIDIIETPNADFDLHDACIGATNYFLDQSTGDPIDWQWYFGDGSTSSQQNPTHEYTSPGTYNVTLIIMNECFCSDTITQILSINATPGPEIECIGPICADSCATYSTPAVCGSYNWVVTGGTIASGGGTSDDFVEVCWGNGPIGEIQLGVSGCSGVFCSTPTTVIVPIVPKNFLIDGETIVCHNAIETYSLPCLSGTQYNWTVTGSGSIISGQGTPAIDVQWTNGTSGTVIAELYNPTLACGGTDSLQIDLRPEFLVFTFPTEVCIGQTSTFFTNYTDTYNWMIYDASGTLIQYDPAITGSYTYTWTNPGTYTIITSPVNPNTYCNDSLEVEMQVVFVPKPDTILGATEICPGSPTTYTAVSAVPGVNFEWFVQNGTPATYTGNPISVTWTPNSGPYCLGVRHKQMSNPLCPSDTIQLCVDSFNLGTPVISGVGSCTNNNSSFSVAVTGLPADATFNWSVSPVGFGSIVSGQGSQNVNIAWGATPGTATVSVDILYCGRTLSASQSVNIIAPVQPVLADVDLCPGATATLNPGSGFVAYSWSTGASSSTISVNSGGSYSVTTTDGNLCTATATAVVTEVPAPTASISTPDPTSYCTPDPVNTTLYVLDDGQGYTYSWTPSGSGNINNVTSPGLYTVVVTNSFGCTTSDAIAITQGVCPPDTGSGNCRPMGRPAMAINQIANRCNFFQFTNNSTAFGSHSWNFGDGTFSTEMNPTHLYSPAGYYTVTLTINTPNNAPPPDSCQLRISEVIKVDLAADFLCEAACPGQPTTFTDLTTFLPNCPPAGGGYSWDFGDGGNSTAQNPSHVYGAPGTYFVTLNVTSISGCVSRFSKNITIPGPPVANFTHSAPACIGTPVNFFDATSGTPTSWSWNFGDGGTSTLQNPVHTYASPGNYTVTLTSGNGPGCTHTTMQIINVIEPASGFIAVTDSNVFCKGDSAVLTAPVGLSYTWSNGMTIQGFPVFIAGTFGVTVQDLNGCTFTPPPVDIQVHPLPPAVVTSADGHDICAGQFIVLSAPLGAYSYQWYKDGNTLAFQTFSTTTVGTAGQYAVLVTDNITGCSRLSPDFEIRVNPLPSVSITPLGSTNFCEGGSVQLQANGSGGVYAYSWNTGSASQIVEVTEDGFYTVTVIDTNGCEAQASINVEVYPAPEICLVMSGCVELCLPDTLYAPPGFFPGYYSYQWMYNGANVAPPSGTNQWLEATVPGDYQLILTTINGCIDTSDLLQVDPKPCGDSCIAAVDPIFQKILSPITISSDEVWAGKYYFGPGVIVTVDGSTLDLTNVDIVFDECAGIDFVNESLIRANNSVFRPCDMNRSWRGFRFESGSRGIIDECTFKNAMRALEYDGNNPDGTIGSTATRIQNNLFSNCHRSIVSRTNHFDEGITGNTFVIENTEVEFNAAPCADDHPYAQSDYIGIHGYQTDFSAQIAQNDFVNSAEEETNRRFFGIYGFWSEMRISLNNFTDMYRSIDLARINKSYVENNRMEVTREFPGAVHQLRITTKSRNSWITGNDIRNSNDYQKLSGSNSAIYMERASNITVNENHIEGFQVGIQSHRIYNSYIGDNDIINCNYYGIYCENVVRVDIACNRINLDQDRSVPTRGISMYRTAPGFSRNKIRSNCISETWAAIHCENTSFYAALPTIKNNFMYNYEKYGVINIGFSGNLGGLGGTFNVAGRNSFISNNIPNGACDVSSTNTMLLAGNYGITSVCGGPFSSAMAPFYNSTASCGLQINENSNIQEIGADERCDAFKANLEGFVLEAEEVDPVDFKLADGFAERLATLETDLRIEVIAFLLQLLDEAPAQQASLMNAVVNDQLISGAQLQWFLFDEAIGKGEVIAAEQILNDLNAESIDDVERKFLESIFLSLNDADPLESLSSRELLDIELIASGNSAQRHLANELQRYLMGDHDYQFAKLAELGEGEPGATRTLLDQSFLTAVPNPSKDAVKISFNALDTDAQLRVVDLRGRLVADYRIETNATELALNVQNWERGIYLLHLLENGKVTAVERFVKM